jgi:hypothetical protein
MDAPFVIGKLQVAAVAQGLQFTCMLEQLLMVIWLGNYNIGHTGLFYRIYKRLFGIQTVCGDNDGQFRVSSSDVGYQTFAGIYLTILFFCAVCILEPTLPEIRCSNC